MNKILSNEKVVVTFQDQATRPYIMVKDTTDPYNEPTGFTQNVRGINKAWDFLSHLFTQEDLVEGFNIHEILGILDKKFKLKTHFYYAMD